MWWLSKIWKDERVFFEDDDGAINGFAYDLPNWNGLVNSANQPIGKIVLQICKCKLAVARVRKFSIPTNELYEINNDLSETDQMLARIEFIVNRQYHMIDFNVGRCIQQEQDPFNENQDQQSEEINRCSMDGTTTCTVKQKNQKKKNWKDSVEVT